MQAINNPPVNLDTSNNSNSDSVRTYLALGDSYTIGQAVAEAERFPQQAVQLLRKQNIKISEPQIIAVTGWTTTDLINALKSEAPLTNYSIVSLLIGVNNQYQQNNTEEYKTEFTFLLNRAISYARNNKRHVIVLSIPDYSVTPFAKNYDKEKIASEINLFNEANKAISIQLGVNYLDITTISQEAKNDPYLIATDGLHPSGLQYKRWADLLVPIMQKILQ